MAQALATKEAILPTSKLTAAPWPPSEETLTSIWTRHGTRLYIKDGSYFHGFDEADCASSANYDFMEAVGAALEGRDLRIKCCDAEIIPINSKQFCLFNGNYGAAAPSATEIQFDRQSIGPWEVFSLGQPFSNTNDLAEHESFLHNITRNAKWTYLFNDLPDDTIVERNKSGELTITEVENGVFLKCPGIMGTFEDGEFKAFYESSAYPGREMELRRLTHESAQPLFEKVTEVESAAPFCVEWCDNYWHWTTEFLPYAVALYAQGYQGCFIVSAQFGFAAHSLMYFGIPQERIILLDGDIVKIKNMTVIKRTEGKSMRRDFAIFERLRKFAYANDVSSPLGDRLIILRRKSRSLVNEKEVVGFLLKKGFEVVYMEDYSYEEQIAIATNASFICGPHGAGITACMFMKKAGCVLEFFAPTYVNPCMLSFVDALNLNYGMTVSRVYQGAAYPNGLDVFVDLDLLSVQISTLLKTSETLR